MDIRDRRELRRTADEALRTARGGPKKTVAVYVGASCLLSLALTVASYVLDSRISDTSGLQDLGLRSVLSTGQTLLPVAQMLLLLCWGMGYTICTLRILRGAEVRPHTLLEGFRCFGTVLLATLLQGLIYLAVAFATMYASYFLFLILPVSEEFYELLMPLLTSGTTDISSLLDDATLSALTNAMIPMLVIFVALFCCLATPIVYQYRMVNRSIADNPGMGAIAAMRQSRRMMRRNRFALFRLDLSFWWFYLADVFATALAYFDTLLPALGVIFPWSDSVSYYLFYILSLVVQALLYIFALNRVEVTYAAAYDSLRPRPTSQGVALGNIFNM